MKDRARGRCEAQAHVEGCDGIGRDCDHVRRGDDHSLGNLQLLSTECHKAKTEGEKQTALAAKRSLRRLPVEQHPSKSSRG